MQKTIMVHDWITRWIISFFILSTWFPHTDGGILSIYSHKFDENTNTYLLSPMNQSSPSNYKVGVIQAYDTTSTSRRISFSILDVVVISQDKKTIHPKNVGELLSWKFIARDLQNNDCDETTLSKYPEFRRQFCINHYTGEIYTTKYFVQSPPPSGLRYIFHIQYKSPPITYGAGVKPHSVLIVSVCDNMQKIYKRMLNKCRIDGAVSVPMETMKSVATRYSSNMYFTGIKFLLNVTSLNTETYRPSKKDKILVGVPYPNGTMAWGPYFVYIFPDVYTALITPPIKVRVIDVPDMRITVFVLKVSNERIVWVPPPSMMVATFLPVDDYCSDRGSCTNESMNYVSDATMYRDRCILNNDDDFIGKYNYCNDNLPPVVQKATGNIDWDDIQHKRLPRLLHSAYVKDDKPFPLKYKLLKVSSKYPKPRKIVNTTSHIDCPTSLVNLNIPMAYFCVNADNGSIYSTKALVDDIVADDVFTLTINIKDIVAYPPRMLNISISLTSMSVCTARTIAFRKLVNSECGNTFHKTEIIDNVNTLADTKSDSARFSLNITEEDRSGVFYVTGLWGKENLINESPDRDGNYVGVKISSNRGMETEAKYFFSGTYSSFNPPLKYIVGETLTLSSSYLYNAKRDDITSYPFQRSTWLMILIKEYDYCSASPGCIDLYKSYDAEYQKNVAEIDRKCPNKDWYGFQAKFASCADNDAPVLGKTDYVLERSAASISSEVIPTSSLPMYITDTNPLKYHLRKVTSNEKFNKFQRIVSLKWHKSCTSGQLTPPESFFCINNVTGRIYSTSDLTLVKLTVATYFTFTVNVIDDTKYPMRSKTFNLKLTIQDQCSPASNTYNDLTTCAEYKGFIGSNIKDNSLYFNPTQQIQRVLAIKFKISELRLVTGTDIAGEVTVTNLQKIALPTKTTARVSIANTTKEIYQTLAIYLPRMDQGHTVTARFIKYSTSAEPTNIDVTNMDPKKFVLLTMVSYKCETGCVDKYTRWRGEARNATKKSKVDCSKDPKYYAVNFDRCLDPRPTFKSTSPTISEGIISGSNVTISNAVYNSPFQIKSAYWLKNGEERINMVVKLGIPEYGEGSNLPQYTVPDLTLNNVQLSNQGYYQSCVEFKGKSYLSKKVSLKLTDVAESRISMSINTTWSNDYKMPSTTTYQKLESQLIRRINNRIKQFDANADRIVEVISFSGPQTVTAKMKIFISNANEATRLNYCEIIRKAITNGKLGTWDITDVKITTLDCCLEDISGDIAFKGVYTFDTTIAGNVSHKTCVYPEGGNTKIMRNCIVDMENGARWAPVDLTACKTRDETTQKLLELKVVVDKNNVEEISKNVSAVAGKENMNNVFDIKIISDIITSVVNLNSSSTKVATNVLNTVDAILQSDKEVVIGSNTKSNSSTKILDNLDALALSQTTTEKGKLETIITESISLAVIEPKDDEPLTIYSSDSKDKKTEMSLQRNDSNAIKAVVTLPREVVKKAAGAQIYSYVFKADTLFLPKNNQPESNKTEIKEESFVQSYVVSIVVSNTEVVNLTKPIVLTFTTETIANKTGKSHCKYWDPYFVSSTGNIGVWSSTGCETTIGVNNTVTCECDHLTNFAIILDVSQSFNNALALQIVSYIGCGISIVGLLLTIVTNLIFKKIRQKVPSKILVNLSISLLLTLVIFLGGAERVEPRIGCRIVATLIQYFVLATFFWMAVEGLNLYRNFVKVFSGGSKGKFLLKCNIFGWGGPLLITAATAGAQWHKMGPSGPDDGQFCVLQGTPFYFALLLPICIILVGNSVVLVLVLRGITGGSKLKNDSPKDKKNKVATARIAFACAALLGLTWLFGILAVGALRDTFQWLFCIFNSLQGFFIFIFYTVRSVDARREWMVLLGIKSAKGLSGSMSSSRKVSSLSLSSSTKKVSVGSAVFSKLKDKLSTTSMSK